MSHRLLLCLLTLTPLLVPSAIASDRPTPVPMLHVSDLFRPHIDPDDHWDLGCVYALGHQANAAIKGILIDSPPPGRKCDPDVLAVSQLNYLTGLSVPAMVGSPRPAQSQNDAQFAKTSLEDGGVRAVLRLLRESPRPVVISILGSCNDVAMAASIDPKLFREKCAAVYLNAGTGTPDKTKAARLEYNVGLNRAAYAAIFALPCPVYWMPCFEEIPKEQEWQVMEFGTYYRFSQGDILPHLSARMKNFFAYIYRHGHTEKNASPPGSDWLRYLLGPNDDALLAHQGTLYRNMWCTGGFLHAAGLTVLRDGRIVPRAGNVKDAVFRFAPIRVTCSDNGVTEWTQTKTSSNRFIFRVLDRQNYASAMTTAMRTLLETLP